MTPLQVSHRHREVVLALLAIAGVAWWWTARRMAGMDAGPGTDLGTIGWFTGSWAVMMAAMMLPSFAPTLAAYLMLTGGRSPSRWLWFAGGYLLTWAAAGVVAYGLFELGKALLADELAWHRGGRWLCAGVLVAAAVYEFIPLKNVCLTRCRGQLGHSRGAPADGWSSPLWTGIRSGGWCIGCSGALMAALFALGVMSLTWMVLLAGLIALEKVGPWPSGARVVTATALALLAAGILLVPHQVPGLVVPGSQAMHAMKSMS